MVLNQPDFDEKKKTLFVSRTSVRNSKLESRKTFCRSIPVRLCTLTKYIDGTII